MISKLIGERISLDESRSGAPVDIQGMRKAVVQKYTRYFTLSSAPLFKSFKYKGVKVHTESDSAGATTEVQLTFPIRLSEDLDPDHAIFQASNRYVFSRGSTTGSGNIENTFDRQK